MNIGYGLNQSGRIFLRRGRCGAHGSWQRFEHLLHNLRLQL